MIELLSYWNAIVWNAIGLIVGIPLILCLLFVVISSIISIIIYLFNFMGIKND